MQLLFRRAIGDPGHKRIFCLVHAEKLHYRVGDSVLKLLDEITQGQSGKICCTSVQAHILGQCTFLHRLYRIDGAK